jgi:hypothetical protein
MVEKQLRDPTLLPRLGLAWLLAAALAACADPSECNYGQTLCDGTVAQVCLLPCHEPGCYRVWNHTDCAENGQICVDPGTSGQNAFCALSAKPDSRCAGAESFCDGHQHVTCNASGYPVSSESCGALLCVEASPGHSLCALSSIPDPKCAGGALGFCSGTTASQCTGRFVTGTQVCSHACVESQETGPFCALSGEPDPSCAVNFSYCRGSDETACREGFATARWPCTVCKTIGRFASCTGADGGSVTSPPSPRENAPATLDGGAPG